MPSAGCPAQDGRLRMDVARRGDRKGTPPVGVRPEDGERAHVAGPVELGGHLDSAGLERVERAAAQELRSVNAEIEILLREALARRGLKLAPPEQRPRGRPPKE